MGLLEAFKQYVRDASPGGLLNPEVPIGGPTALAKGLLGFTPVVGDAISAYDAVQSAREGDYLGAALNGVGVLPLVPAMGGTLKESRKWLKNMKKAGKTVDGRTVTGNIPNVSSVGSSLKYQLEHKPMTIAGGAAPLHDVESVFGPDIFSKNALQYFGGGDVYARQEKAVIDLMRKVKGNPNAMVTIYRGVPDGVNKINAGDWVTLDPKIAELYGRKVLKMDVPASHVTSWPDSLLEFGYYPK
jgi:hypothetical protein